MMPRGVEVEIVDDEATIAFVDPTLRGQGLAALLAAGGPDAVGKVTIPRTAYIVPVDVARAAGLLDEVPPFADGGVILGPSAPSDDSVPVVLDPGHIVPVDDGSAFLDAITGTVEVPADPGPAAEAAGGETVADAPTLEAPVSWPEGEPTDEWHRPELNSYAEALGITGASDLPNKAAVLAAIKENQS